MTRPSHSEPADSSHWPLATRRELEAFYGLHDLDGSGRPTGEWESAHLIRVTPPYPMVLAWQPETPVGAILCHVRVAGSLARALGAIRTALGSDDAVRAARLHLFGGCYCFRRIAGSASLSTHAWGAAVDLDPDRNPRGRAFSPGRGMMHPAAVAAFTAEGWTWGGAWTRNPDPMHFQAARIGGRPFRA